MTYYQSVCKKLVKTINNEDVYPTFPKLGEANMIQRVNPWKGIEGSTKHQMLLNIALSGLSPELDLAGGASGVLCGNSLYHNPDRTDIQETALGEIYSGKKIGCIGITEMDRGSDAVNMEMAAKIFENGDINYNGTKIYTTNGVVADYFSTYGVTDISNPRRTMMLALFKREDEGLSSERLNIPAAKGVGIGKVKYEDVTVPKDRLLAAPGEGYKRLFRGLTPERMGIIGNCVGGVWHALATATIFTQIRTQFGASLFKYQGISHTLADIYSKVASNTAFAFQIADFYDKKVGNVIHRGEKPNSMDEGSVAIQAAQGKYLTAKMYHKAVYELVQTMGGRGALDEDGSSNIINRLENISRIGEVVGGHRNIQMMIVEAGLKATTQMSINSYIQKSKRQLVKKKNILTDLYLERGSALISTEDSYLSEGTKTQLQKIITKVSTLNPKLDTVEYKAFASYLPKAVENAEKERYKAMRK